MKERCLHEILCRRGQLVQKSTFLSLPTFGSGPACGSLAQKGSLPLSKIPQCFPSATSSWISHSPNTPILLLCSHWFLMLPNYFTEAFLSMLFHIEDPVSVVASPRMCPSHCWQEHPICCADKWRQDTEGQLHSCIKWEFQLAWHVVPANPVLYICWTWTDCPLPNSPLYQATARNSVSRLP